MDAYCNSEQRRKVNVTLCEIVTVSGTVFLLREIPVVVSAFDFLSLSYSSSGRVFALGINLSSVSLFLTFPARSK